MPSLLIVAAITVLRLVLLAFNKTDLFVDESQYWLWGQSFDFGYYSKPPLIAWVIRLVTDIAGSDAPFWVRAPGAVFHAATAMILAALAARMMGGRVAVWVAASYVTLPMVALGSLLMSTDTIMAPFFAAALLFHRRLLETGALRFAAMAGAMAGMAFLAKYIALFFLVGVVLAALLLPAARISLKAAGLMILTFGIVILPNIVWNLNHDLATVSHTMDNVQWVREDTPLSGLNLTGLIEFVASQFAVFGPILFAALLVALRRPGGFGGLLAFSLPVLLVISAEAVLARAYANWAVSAYFAGTLVAVAVLIARPWVLAASLAINGAICVALPSRLR